MSTIRDAWLRKFATQLPLGIDIKDDDGNVIHSSIGDPKTHKITLYSAWLGKSSGGSTGGNTGTGGDSGNAGGDTGGTTNPGHETVGDDVYPGDVNKGEVTKRFKLWQGPSNTNADTTVTFNQDLGDNLDGLGDGLQARISMVETPYLDGVATSPRTLKLNSTSLKNWDYETSIPVPISFKKGRVASKDKLLVSADFKNNKIFYSSKVLQIPKFTTATEYPEKTIFRNIDTSLLNSKKNTTPAKVSDSAILINLGTNGAQPGKRIVATKNDSRVGVGLIGNGAVIAEGLTPNTRYAAGDIKIHYEDINGNVLSNEVNVEAFNTDGKYQEPNNIYSFVYPNTGVSATPYSNGFWVSFSVSQDGRRLGILDGNNNLVASSSMKFLVVYIDGLKPDTEYSGYKLVVYSEHEISDTDVVTSPSISFKYGDDADMIVSPVQGSIKDSTGTLLSTYDIIIDYMNSYTVQNAVSQINPQDILFDGASTDVQLREVSKYFDNISDGLEIHLVNYVQQGSGSNLARFKLTDMNFPVTLKIPREYIFGGVSTFDLSNYFKDVSNKAVSSGYYKYTNGAWVYNSSNTLGITVTTCDVKATLQNGSIEFSGNVHNIRSGYEGIWTLQIASVNTYKEGE